MLKIAKDLFDLLYPVGTYYETSNANWTPSSAGWYGTWVEDTAGRITVSKSTDTEFNSIGKTGGSKYMQSHYHELQYYINNGNNMTGGYDKFLVYGMPEGSTYYASHSYPNVQTGDSGNLQPYIVVRRWHRTA